MANSFREEKDSLGKKKVPNEAFYGIFTQRAKENFPISGEKAGKEFLEALLYVKIASAKANTELGLLAPKTGKAVSKAGRRIVREKDWKEFPLDVFQAGAGTPYNMNANEVLANKANVLLGGKKGTYKPVHPNDHVNLCQSSNNVVPTAVRVAGVPMALELVENVSGLEKSFKRLAGKYGRIVKSGRTHLQDAVPVSWKQVFNAYAFSLGKKRKAVEKEVLGLRKLSIGGTAIGTGFGAAPKFNGKAVRHLGRLAGVKFESAENFVDATQSYADFLSFSNSLNELGVELNRIANDLRLLSSGPNTGLGEVKLPEAEPGSSIMPGKINPSVPEMVNMVCFQVAGNNKTIELAAGSSQLELNFTAPLVGLNLVQSLKILKNAVKAFDSKCVRGLKVNEKASRDYFEKSLGMGTILNRFVGYEKAAEVVKEARGKNRTILEVVREKRLLSEKEIRKLFSPSFTVKPNLEKKKQPAFRAGRKEKKNFLTRMRLNSPGEKKNVERAC